VIVSGRLRSSPKMVSSAGKLFRPEHIEETLHAAVRSWRPIRGDLVANASGVVTFATASSAVGGLTAVQKSAEGVAGGSAADVARSSSTGNMLSSAKTIDQGQVLSAFCRAVTSTSTIGFGVLRGLYIPYQVVASNPGTPASGEVGTFGKVGTRLLAVIA
jgi:hypothetical protein